MKGKFFSQSPIWYRRVSRGFSLLEVVIVVFMFAIIMTAVTAYFAKTVSVNQTTKLLQRNLEDTQLAFNLIGKVLRTSVVVATTPDLNATSVRIYDYSQKLCIEYRFFGGSLQSGVASGSPSPGDDEKTWCQGASFGSLSNMITTTDGASVTGHFIVVPSSASVAGRVTLVATVTRGTNSSSIQTTASLRNYTEYLP